MAKVIHNLATYNWFSDTPRSLIPTPPPNKVIICMQLLLKWILLNLHIGNEFSFIEITEYHLFLIDMLCMVWFVISLSRMSARKMVMKIFVALVFTIASFWAHCNFKLNLWGDCGKVLNLVPKGKLSQPGNRITVFSYSYFKKNTHLMYKNACFYSCYWCIEIS